jgi:hypothetical protein
VFLANWRNWHSFRRTGRHFVATISAQINAISCYFTHFWRRLLLPSEEEGFRRKCLILREYRRRESNPHVLADTEF